MALGQLITNQSGVIPMQGRELRAKLPADSRRAENAMAFIKPSIQVCLKDEEEEGRKGEGKDTK